MPRRSFEQVTLLPGADPAAVWARVTSWAGVNAELAPIRMSHPPGCPDLASIPADGTVHVVSTLRVLGIPFDRHRLALRAFEPGHRFDELSSNLMLRYWSHERVVEAVDAGVRVIDRCTLEARGPLPDGLLLVVYRWIFRRRHHRLRAAFALPATPPAPGNGT